MSNQNELYYIAFVRQDGLKIGAVAPERASRAAEILASQSHKSFTTERVTPKQAQEMNRQWQNNNYRI